LARVYDWDGTGTAPAELVTGADGYYTFPYVTGGVYRLEVEPPAPWRFPSSTTHVPSDPSHVVDPDGSYGRPFVVPAPGGPVVLDLPCDAVRVTTLFVEKTAARTVLEPGDDVELDVAVANRSAAGVDSVVLGEVLPRGFAYLRGTA